MDVYRYVILLLKFVTDKNYLAMPLCVWDRWSLDFGERKRKSGFQGDGENLQQIQPQYRNKNIVCVSKQGRIWPTKIISRKIQG